MCRSKLAQAFRLCIEEFSDCIRNPKLYIILLMMFFFLNREFANELISFTSYDKIPSFWEIWPYCSCDYEKMLIIWCGYFILISDIPMQGDRLSSFIIRTQKWVYALSQQLFIIIFSIFYFIVIQIETAVIFSCRFNFDNRWTAYTKQVLVGEYNAPARISFDNKPLQMYIFSAVLFLIIMFFIGMIILDFNLYVKRVVGYIVAIVLLVFDIALQIVDIPALNWFSPVTLARLTGINLGYNYDFPHLRYSLSVILGLIIIFTLWLYTALKTYDFQKGGTS